MYPILFQIGPITFKTLGVFLAFAFLASSFIIINYAIKRKMNLDFISDHLLSFLFVTLISSRLFFVIENWYKYTSDLFGIIKLQDGGFSFWGGFLGFTSILLFWTHRKKAPFWKWFDIIILASMLGMAISYIGFFFSGGYYGKPTDLFFGVTFDNPEVRFTDPVHPTQFYGAIFALIIFFILLFLAKRKRKEGVIALTGIMLFTILTILSNFFLGDRLAIISEFTVTQIMSAVIFLITLVIFIMRSQTKLKTNINS